jgi:hypothetical protein
VHPPRPSQVELVSHSPAVHVYAVPRHVPLVHTSSFVHALLSLHVVVLDLLLHAVVEADTVHTWHAFVGFVVPSA